MSRSTAWRAVRGQLLRLPLLLRGRGGLWPEPELPDPLPGAPLPAGRSMTAVPLAEPGRMGPLRVPGWACGPERTSPPAEMFICVARAAAAAGDNDPPRSVRLALRWVMAIHRDSRSLSMQST